MELKRMEDANCSNNLIKYKYYFNKTKNCEKDENYYRDFYTLTQYCFKLFLIFINMEFTKINSTKYKK